MAAAFPIFPISGSLQPATTQWHQMTHDTRCPSSFGSSRQRPIQRPLFVNVGQRHPSSGGLFSLESWLTLLTMTGHSTPKTVVLANAAPACGPTWSMGDAIPCVAY